MANPDETFDPNDLESIDALLDEAELEAVSDDSEFDESLSDEPAGSDAPAQDEPMVEPEVEPDVEPESVSSETDDLLDSLDDLVADEETNPTSESIEQVEENLAADPEPEVVSVSEPVKGAKDNSKAAVESEADVDDFLEKRAAAQAAKNSNLSVEEMDSIKKLIIIFGSVLSVLVLTAIGIGVWSALAASSAGVDEETKTLIESIKVSSEQNGSAIHDAEKISKSVEKKLDAINYQLEQLAADLANLEAGKAKPAEEVIDPLGLGTQAAPQHSATATPVAHQAAPVAAAVPPVVAHDEELMKKVSAVSSRLYKAHKRIDEVNKRVKAMQAQSAALVQSMKLIEREALVTQAAREEEQRALEERNKKAQGNPYRYSAPDGGFYDQSVSDSYP